MKNVTVFQFTDSSITDKSVRYFDSLELSKEVLFRAIDNILDDNPNALIHITPGCSTCKPVSFEIHCISMSVLSLSDL